MKLLFILFLGLILGGVIGEATGEREGPSEFGRLYEGYETPNTVEYAAAAYDAADTSGEPLLGPAVDVTEDYTQQTAPTNAHEYNYPPRPYFDHGYGHGGYAHAPEGYGYGYFRRPAVYLDSKPWTPVVKKPVVPVVKKAVSKPLISVGPAYQSVVAADLVHKPLGHGLGYGYGHGAGHLDYHVPAYKPVVKAPVVPKVVKPVVTYKPAPPVVKPVVPFYKPTPFYVTPSLSYGYSYKLVPTYAYGPAIVNDHGHGLLHGAEGGGYADAGHGDAHELPYAYGYGHEH